MKHFHRHINQLNLNTLDFSKLDVTTENGNSLVKIASPYSSFDESDPEISNFDKINRSLTRRLPSRDVDTDIHTFFSPDKLYESRNRNINILGSHDRYIWSGEIKNESIFKASSYVINNSNMNSDGYMFLPTPVHKQNQQTSMRVKLKFNNLPPNTFVPLCGYVYKAERINNTISSNNSSFKDFKLPTNYAYLDKQFSNNWVYNGSCWSSSSWYSDWDATVSDVADIPLAFSATTDNVYGASNAKFQEHSYDFWGDYTKNTLVWFLYAYDNNGKSMIVMCSGEEDGQDDSENIYRPYNELYGVNDANGMSNFLAPKFLRDYLSQAGNTLQTLYNDYQAGSQTFGDSRDHMNLIHRYVCPNAATDYRAHDADGYAWFDFPVKSCQNAQGGGAPYGVGRVNHLNMQILSFGSSPAGNANLSNVTEFLLNANTISHNSENSLGINYYGMTASHSYVQLTSSGKITNYYVSPYNEGISTTVGQIFYTGSLDSLSFKEIPGQTFLEKCRTRQYYFYYNVSAYRRASIGSYDAGGVYAGALVLRPTFNEGGEIHDAIIANYDNKGLKSTPETGGSELYHDFYTPHPDTQYIFPKFNSTNFAFDGLEESKNNNGIHFVDQTSSWEGEADVLTDNNSTIKNYKVGEANSLLIPISDLSGFPSLANNADYSISKITIRVKGLMKKTFNPIKLHCAILNANLIKVLETDQVYGTSFDDEHTSIDISNFILSNVYPLYNDSLYIKFGNSVNNSIDYSDIKDGFLKIWFDPKQ